MTSLKLFLFVKELTIRSFLSLHVKIRETIEI